MLNRPKPKTFTAEESEAILKASQAQQAGSSTGVPKSYDENFPVFDIPVNQKVLAYVPNHTMVLEDGRVDILADRFCAHPVRVGNMYTNMRCNSEVISEKYGLDGSCPLCNGVQDCWNLYMKKRDNIAASKGIIKDDKNPQAFKEAMKDDSKRLLQEMAIRDKEEWLTFPIVVIDCEEKDGVRSTKVKLSADGKVQGKPYWYQIRKTSYIDKWMKALENSVDANGDSLTHPAGQWIVLDFTVRDFDKINKADQKMRSAKELQVTVRTMGEDYAQWAKYFDDLTAEWTPLKAIEVCSLNSIRDRDEMLEAAQEILAKTQQEIQMFEIGAVKTAGAIGMNNTGTVGNAEDALASFGGTTNNVGVSV